MQIASSNTSPAPHLHNTPFAAPAESIAPMRLILQVHLLLSMAGPPGGAPAETSVAALQWWLALTRRLRSRLVCFTLLSGPHADTFAYGNCATAHQSFDLSMASVPQPTCPPRVLSVALASGVEIDVAVLRTPRSQSTIKRLVSHGSLRLSVPVNLHFDWESFPFKV